MEIAVQSHPKNPENVLICTFGSPGAAIQFHITQKGAYCIDRGLMVRGRMGIRQVLRDTLELVEEELQVAPPQSFASDPSPWLLVELCKAIQRHEEKMHE